MSNLPKRQNHVINNKIMKYHHVKYNKILLTQHIRIPITYKQHNIILLSILDFVYYLSIFDIFLELLLNI